MNSRQLDREVRDILACPYCKTRFAGGLESVRDSVRCLVCDAVFPIAENGVIDFRITPPRYAQTLFHAYWSAGQQGYENWARSLPDNIEYYLEQIEQGERGASSCYNYGAIEGILLDVGGNDGRLRHFLKPEVTYVSLDPYLTVMEDLVRGGRLAAYPVLAKPCNFVCGRAEQLPFIHMAVDYVRCHSVLDHLWDPFLSLREMYRVLKPGGILLLGVYVVDTPRRPLYEDVKKIIKFFLRRPLDRHIWHPTREELKELIKAAGFQWLRDTFIDETGMLEIIMRRAKGKEE